MVCKFMHYETFNTLDVWQVKEATDTKYIVLKYFFDSHVINDIPKAHHSIYAYDKPNEKEILLHY